MAKMAKKKIARKKDGKNGMNHENGKKIDGKNGNFRHFRHGENREKK